MKMENSVSYAPKRIRRIKAEGGKDMGYRAKQYAHELIEAGLSSMGQAVCYQHC